MPEVPTRVWDDFCQKLLPHSDIDEEPEAIRFDVSPGRAKVEAYVSEPWPSFTWDENSDEEVELGDSEELEGIDWEGQPSNETVDIYTGPAANWVRSVVIDLFDEVFEDTGKWVNCSVESGVLTSDGVAVTFRVVKGMPRRCTTIDEQLLDIFVDDGYIDSQEDLAYGTFEVIGSENDDSEFDPHVDGTMYRYTDDPHRLWGDLDSFEDWLDRAADSPADRERLESKETYTEHFHPTEYGLDTDSPYLAWKGEAENTLFESIVLSDTGSVLRRSFGEIYVDNSVVSLYGYVIAGDDIEKQLD